ncbi:MAG: flippase [Bacteroidota bacterium]
MFKTQISQLAQNKSFKKYFSNTSWLLGGKILQMAITFLVTASVGRELGPEFFGSLSYARGIVVFMMVFVAMGMSGINVRNLVQRPEEKGKILGTAIGIRLSMAFFMGLIFLLTIPMLKHHTPIENTLILIMLGVGLFRPFYAFDDFFQSEIKSKYSVLARSTAAFSFAGIQVFLLSIGAPIIWHGVAFLVRHVIETAGYLIMHIKHYGWPSLSFSKEYAKEVLRETWPMIFSNAVVFIYMKADQFMIRGMLGRYEIGQYSAALRLSEAWFILGPILSSSLFPAIIKAKKKSAKNYVKNLQRYFDIMAIMGICIAIPVALLGPQVLQWDILFGKDYSDAGQVLMVHVWTLSFVYLGNAGTKYLILESLQKLAMYRSILGAILNILLNLYMIPRWGIMGAAYATLISQAFASYFAYAFSPKTKVLFGMMTKSLFLISPIQQLKSIIAKRA